MKTFLRIVAAFLILVLITGFVIVREYPFLSPFYRDRYPAAGYFALIDTTPKPSDATELMESFDACYPYWIGTKWDFNGISQTPGEGSIACGYFVTTMMRDLHFDIPRIALAQCASEEMIKALVDEPHISRFNGSENEVMFSRIREKGRHLYIIGLDNHTGFVYHDGTEIWFIHSSGAFPYRVVKTKAESSKTINSSKYKVLGTVTESKILFP